MHRRVVVSYCAAMHLHADGGCSDYAASRLAASAAVGELLKKSVTITIHKRPSGQPFVTVPGCAPLSISLSHDSGHAVAAVRRTGCVGVDLCLLARMRRLHHTHPQRLVHHVGNPMGLSGLTEDPADALAIIWASKEAVVKCQAGPAFATTFTDWVQTAPPFCLLDLRGAAMLCTHAFTARFVNSLTSQTGTVFALRLADPPAIVALTLQ
eukprot:NODE_4673_length_755_cov_36.972930_g4513_i0.p1 GENE.NODE_4673_length_755_cov_36.972930_g4513_i0~~NODE_4673_length_755_cov_36.972930_g4513_i0.p1  ORF type:complete len:222 (+),score=29.65 NODE_4673_length_755_cov_36.972930_g4513_i0:37-666(+)